MSPVLFLAGDVMTGRGIDRILPHPGDPSLREPWATSAEDYVELARRRHGPIEAPVSFSRVWGDALEVLDGRGPAVRIVNLETAVTRKGERAPKGIHYRMSPENVPVLTAAGIDAAVLANNHVLDFGEEGLVDTLEALERAAIAPAGAGRDLEEALAPAALPLPDGGRVLLFARGAPSSGIPEHWEAKGGGAATGPLEEEAAGPATRPAVRRPGIAFLPRLSQTQAARLAANIERWRRPGDIVVVSLHWGPNWGYRIERRERAFARRLVEEGVDVVHGHSSHHPRPLELHRDRAILYGCGDFLNDYEGIQGHQAYRPELVLGYLLTLDPSDGALLDLELVPFRLERLRLVRASRDEAAWLRDTLDHEGGRKGAKLEVDGRGSLRLAERSS